MASNFTVILFQRQHFGNQQGTFNNIEPNVPFVGPSKDFSFNCPNVDPGETAFLMFQSRDVDHQRNVFQINGIAVFGGLPASPSRDTWNGNILLIDPTTNCKRQITYCTSNLAIQLAGASATSMTLSLITWSSNTRIRLGWCPSPRGRTSPRNSTRCSRRW